METSNARGEWIREWQGSGPQRGFHIREATRLHNNRVVAYLGDQVDGEQVDKLIAEHNGCHANGDPIHDAPSAPVGVECNCPGAGKTDPELHAPNCPKRLAQQPAAVDDAMVERVAFAIHRAMKPSNLTDSDWTSGAILGFENSYRDMVMQAARAAIAIQHQEPTT